MKKRLGVLSVVTILVMAFFALSAVASSSEMYFATDKNGQNRVTNIQEGTEVWVAIYDTDENIDCDVRDKIWTDIKIMDPKTGAYIVWVSYSTDELGAEGPNGDPESAYDTDTYWPWKGHYPGNSAGSLNYDYLEETGADTGLFVSKRSFTVGTRAGFALPEENTHVVDNAFRSGALADLPWDFQGGNYEYSGDPAHESERGAYADNFNDAFETGGAVFSAGSYIHATAFLPDPIGGEAQYMLGRFENMDTLIGMYQDQNDETDVATAMMKIIDTEATITWDQEIYKDGNGSATITVCDADENLDCNKVEYVPVFIIVNPGSWNPVNWDEETWADSYPSPNSFCILKTTGGVVPGTVDNIDARFEPIRWYNIYYGQAFNEAGFVYPDNDQPESEGAYYMEYPVAGEDNVTFFDTTDELGFCRVMFYAQETGVNTGCFQLNLNTLLGDLGFDSLRVRDVLAAYYLDPNDEDDFKLDVAYIEEKMHSITSFTDATRADKELYWLGRDPVYVQVIDANANVDPCCPEQVVVFICDPHHEDDAEWIVLDETSSNSPVFFSNAGLELLPVWDALGVGDSDHMGGYQLQIDNWKLEAFNEDDVYARYNDVYYVTGEDGISELGDQDTDTAFPPRIDRVRVANDVSFDVMSIADTQVYNGSTVQMWFLDRQGNRVSGYVNSDCVFIEVVDPDQNEDILRRERIDAFWDGGQNVPFGPWNLNPFECDWERETYHPFNALLGDTNIFNNGDTTGEPDGRAWAKIYVLNPRSGQWAALDLLETGVTTGDFVSVICVDLVNVYTCVPTLGTLPGDTIVAFYQDPSNHSDSAMISLKVGIGGGGTPPSQASTTTFVNASGAAVANYTDADLVYVKVVDPSHAGATTLAGLTIGTQTVALAPLAGATNDTFITTGLDLDLAAGATITATYKDATDPTDTSSDTITVIASKLEITNFYAGPTPSAGDVTFGYQGTGVATVMSVTVYDLAGQLVWADDLANVTKIVWNGKDDSGAYVANGAYIYVVEATDGTDTFGDTGTLFINR